MNPILKMTVILLASVFSVAQASEWQLSDDGGICRERTDGEAIQDHFAMSGQHVDVILEWSVDAEGAFQATRVVRFPMLRTIPDNTHASLEKRWDDRDLPAVQVDGVALSAGRVKRLAIHGVFVVESEHEKHLQLTRTIFPSRTSPAVLDLLQLKNGGGEPIRVVIPSSRKTSVTPREQGVWGEYAVDTKILGEGFFVLAPGESVEYAVVHSARKIGDEPYFGDPAAELASRRAFVAETERELVLTTPDPVLNRLFAFSKLHATESIFSTRGGLLHGPGGYGKYLAAIWANDQAEYVNPFFPFLGNVARNESALNGYRLFAKKMTPDYQPIPSSIIAEGRDIWNGARDRGDAAMIAYGASRFCLASGNPQWSEELWPLITWCLEYCDRQKNAAGVIQSDTDELENRFPAGKANLCTSTLCYDALLSAAFLAESLGKDAAVAAEYRAKATALRAAIKNYFEADVEGFPTYRYYEENTVLRSWICIPLTVGIDDRQDGTVRALFSDRLWTDNGLLTQAGTTTVWDRSTLYALRGVLRTSAVDRGWAKLQTFSKLRLLGRHVPYVLEAYPENAGSHLSAESGLYCRIFIEGLFAIRPTGLTSFDCTPRLPQNWREPMRLDRIHAFGRVWNLQVSTTSLGLRVRITDTAEQTLYDQTLEEGMTHHVKF